MTILFGMLLEPQEAGAPRTAPCADAGPAAFVVRWAQLWGAGAARYSSFTRMPIQEHTGSQCNGWRHER